MENLKEILIKNKAWSKEVTQDSPDFFEHLSHQQTPNYLWIGCSDSRVPACTVTGTQPGELFVHRNIANTVLDTDTNCMSVLQYAVEVLKVREIIICGHYGCGGIQAAYKGGLSGIISYWVNAIKAGIQTQIDDRESFDNETDFLNHLCEAHVRKQVERICQSSTVQTAWRQNQPLSVHGIIHNLKTGLLADLNVSATG